MQSIQIFKNHKGAKRQAIVYKHKKITIFLLIKDNHQKQFQLFCDRKRPILRPNRIASTRNSKYVGRGDVNQGIYFIWPEGPVTRCNFSCNLQRNSTLGRCKIGKYMFGSQFANIFFRFKSSSLIYISLKQNWVASCKRNCTMLQGLK